MTYRLDIPGQVSEHQLKAIEAVATLIPANGVVVEVGSLFGCSSYAWAKSVHPSVRVFCIDPWEKNEGVRPMEQRFGIRYGLEQFLEYTRDCPNIVPKKGYSPADFKNWRKKVDLYYEDAVHTNPVLAKNLEFWSSRVKPGGIVCGDDYRPRFPDVQHGAEKLAQKFGRNLKTVDFFWCLLPSDDELPGAGAVGKVLDELSIASDAEKRSQGLRISIGPLASIPVIKNKDDATITIRVANETLDPWPPRPSHPVQPTQVGARIVGARDHKQVASTSVDIGPTVFMPDIPVSYQITLPVEGLPAGDYRAVFDLATATGDWIFRKDISQATGAPVQLKSPMGTAMPITENEGHRTPQKEETKTARPRISTDTPASKTARKKRGLHPADNPNKHFVIDLVVADRGWIVERLAAEILKAAEHCKANFDIKVLDTPSGNAELTYFLPYSVQQDVEGSLVGSWFTHQEAVPEAAEKFIKMAQQADFAVCPAKKYQRLLQGRDVDDVSVIFHGVDLDVYKPKLKIGVIGRTYHTGRKGEDLLARLMGMESVEFRFTGSGWPQPPTRQAGKDLAEFYHSIDYLLIPSRIEGGPVPLFEALACGCPVIASDVGCVEDFPHIHFRNGDAEDLARVIEGLRKERDALRRSVENLSWKRFGLEHLRLFADRIERCRPSNSELVDTARGRVDTVYRPPLQLISHGTETLNKGGPTTRIGLLADAYRAAGGEAVIETSVDSAPSQKRGKRLIHVFNSWPLASAVRQMKVARSANAKCLFSPIALNLCTKPYFEDVLPWIFETCGSAEELEKRVAQVHERTPPWDREAPPLQGVDGHFEHLIEAISLAEGVIYLSEYERDFLNSIGAKPKRARVIQNGVDAQIFAEADPELFARRYGVRNFVLMVGRIETRKNQALTAFALRDLDTPVVAIGHIGDHEYYRQLTRWAGGNFLHIERIDDRALLGSAYKSARCLVLPSWAEGAPLVALEAGCAGTPMVLSTMSSEKEYFGEWAKYVHPADLPGTRQAVKDILDAPEDEQQRNSRSEFTVHSFSIDRHIRETNEFYQQVWSSGSSQLASKESGGASKINEEANIIDITHLAHDLWNKRQLTGVSSVENSLVDAFMRRNNQTRFVLWNSPNRTYIQVTADQVKDGSFFGFANEEFLPKDNLQLIPSITTDAPRSEPTAGPTMEPDLPPFFFAKVWVKDKVSTLPDSVSVPIIGNTQRILRGMRALRAGRKQEAALVALTQNVRLKNIRFEERALPFPLVEGRRLLVLGQPWISNDRQLGDLIRFVQANQLALQCLVHDILYVTDPLSFPEKTRQACTARLTRLLSVADTVIVTSRKSQEDIGFFCQTNQLSCRIQRIHLPLPLARRKEPKAPRLEDQRDFVLYVSSFNQRKNHEFLIGVWRALRKHLSTTGRQEVPDLILAGTPQRGYEKFGEPEYQSELEKDRIIVLNGLSDEEVSWLYEHSLFTVYPSRSEGWGFPPIESALAKKVCIASNQVPSVSENTFPSIIPLDPSDYHGWLFTLESFIERPAMRKAFEEIIDTSALPTWDDCVEDLVDWPSAQPKDRM